MKKLILAECIFLTLFMTGCSDMNSQFDCPMKPGINCKNLDEVNSDIDRRTNNKISPLPVNNFASPDSDHSFRTSDITQRVWIAPFEDTNGNYHEASDVMIVTNHSHWKHNGLYAVNSRERAS